MFTRETQARSGGLCLSLTKQSSSNFENSQGNRLDGAATSSFGQQHLILALQILEFSVLILSSSYSVFSCFLINGW